MRKPELVVGIIGASEEPGRQIAKDLLKIPGTGVAFLAPKLDDTIAVLSPDARISETECNPMRFFVTDVDDPEARKTVEERAERHFGTPMGLLIDARPLVSDVPVDLNP